MMAHNTCKPEGPIYLLSFEGKFVQVQNIGKLQTPSWLRHGKTSKFVLTCHGMVPQGVLYACGGMKNTVTQSTCY